MVLNFKIQKECADTECADTECADTECADTECADKMHLLNVADNTRCRQGVKLANCVQNKTKKNAKTSYFLEYNGEHQIFCIFPLIILGEIICKHYMTLSWPDVEQTR